MQGKSQIDNYQSMFHLYGKLNQIGDFGMARDLMQDEGNYYTSSGGIIPIKWTAPEVFANVNL